MLQLQRLLRIGLVQSPKLLLFLFIFGVDLSDVLIYGLLNLFTFFVHKQQTGLVVRAHKRSIG